MKTTLLRQARRLFINDLAPRHVARHNIRQWVKSVRRLGDKWTLSKKRYAARIV